MRRPSSLRPITVSLLAAAALTAAATVTVLPASAADGTPNTASASDREAVAERMNRLAGKNAAGAYVDRSSGRLIVNVTSAQAARKIRAEGAAARVVDDSLRELRDIKTALDRHGGAVGLSWGVDIPDNSVVVNVPRGLESDRARAFLKVARSYGDAVRVQPVAGKARTMALRPGDAIHTGTSRCSANVVALSGSNEYVLTAGHCTDAGSSWTTGSGQLIGFTAASSFPGNDYGTIRVSDPAALGATNDWISGVGRPPAGSSFCKRGSTTGVTCGVIIGYDRTVRYAQGTVSGLIETNVCVQPGDSGGILYRDSTAVGITSGGTIGGCGSGFRSFFQPVDEPLSVYGLGLK